VARVVIVGGGITGLAAAHRIHRDQPDVEVVVLEAGERPGGLVSTTPFDGLAVDAAADAFLARVPEAVALCTELGIADQLVHPAVGSALVLSGGVLRRLPGGLVLGVPTDLEALEASGIVSPAGVARARMDLEGGGAPFGGDVSVGELVRTRLGDEVMDALVAPLLGGVNAGNADSLSVAVGAPQLAAVADAPSLIAALRAEASAAAGSAPTPVFAGFPTGTATLVDALVGALDPASVRTGSPVTGITASDGGGFSIEVAGTVALTAEAVIVAAPAHATASMVAGLDTGLGGVAEGLATLEWASVAMVTLAVNTDDLDHPLDASGYLVPVTERATVTAVSFASTKWAHLHRPGRAVLRVSAGHAGDASPLDLDDESLVAAVCADLGNHLGLRGRPAGWRVNRWRDALPQYRPGHLERAAAWQRDTWAAHPGVWLTGASFAGLGLPACVRQGNEAARRVGDHLSR